jgi:hypothetical protein
MGGEGVSVMAGGGGVTVPGDRVGPNSGPNVVSKREFLSKAILMAAVQPVA